MCAAGIRLQLLILEGWGPQQRVSRAETALIPPPHHSQPPLSHSLHPPRFFLACTRLSPVPPPSFLSLKMHMCVYIHVCVCVCVCLWRVRVFSTKFRAVVVGLNLMFGGLSVVSTVLCLTDPNGLKSFFQRYGCYLE